MYLIDTHTHIYDHQFSLDRNEAMQRAIDAGVGMMLLPNVDASTITPMLELHEQYPDCTRVMMGLQPEEVKENYKEVLSHMEKELERGIYVGVGEHGVDLTQRVEETARGDAGAQQQEAESVPAKHVPPGGQGSGDAEFPRPVIQRFGDPRHPQERIDEEGRDAQQIGHPVALDPFPQDLVQLLLQAAQAHIHQKEQPARQEIDDAEAEASPVWMPDPHPTC